MKLNKFLHGHILDDGSIDSINGLYEDCPNKDIIFDTFYKRHARGKSIKELGEPVRVRRSCKPAALPKGKWTKKFFENHPDAQGFTAEIYVAKLSVGTDDVQPDLALYKIGVTTNWKRRKGELVHVEKKVFWLTGPLGDLCETEQSALLRFDSSRTSILARTKIDGLREEVFAMSELELEKLIGFIRSYKRELDHSGRELPQESGSTTN